LANLQKIIESYCTFQCWGCRKSEAYPILHDKEWETLLADMVAKGWRRRAFWPPNWDEGPWFCSENCATNSVNAKEAEKYWKKRTKF